MPLNVTFSNIDEFCMMQMLYMYIFMSYPLLHPPPPPHKTNNKNTNISFYNTLLLLLLPFCWAKVINFICDIFSCTTRNPPSQWNNSQYDKIRQTYRLKSFQSINFNSSIFHSGRQYEQHSLPTDWTYGPKTEFTCIIFPSRFLKA